MDGMSDKRFALAVAQLLRSYDKRLYQKTYGNLEKAQAEIYSAFGDPDKTDAVIKLLESTKIKDPATEGQHHTNEAAQLLIDGMKERLKKCLD